MPKNTAVLEHRAAARPGRADLLPDETSTATPASADLAGVRARCIAAASAAGALTLDGVTLPTGPRASAVVALPSETHIADLLDAGASLLYLDATTLTPELADEMSAPTISTDLDPASGRDLARAGQTLRTHLGQTASLTVAAPFAGVLHAYTVTADWVADFHAALAVVAQRHLAVLDAALDREEREDEERATKVKGWFTAIVDRLVADETWLALTLEAPRKQYVRDLAEAELGADLEGPFPYGQRPASMINQAVQIACQRRQQVIAQRAAALTGRLPELAPALAATAGYVGANKETRTQLARTVLLDADPLVVKPGTLVVDLLRVTDEFVAAGSTSPASPTSPTNAGGAGAAAGAAGATGAGGHHEPALF